MKQIFFTFCQTNYSLTGRGGDCARAASAGLSGVETEAFKSMCAWNAPENLLDLPPEDRLKFAPKALKYAEITGQKALVHSVYALPDEETGREGNYFAHVLLDFPEDWNARKALELWESPLWQTSDSCEIQNTLPDVQLSECVPGKITDESFLDFVQNSSHAALFRFLLQNWLVRKPEESIVLCCKPEEAAFCLWGLTRYLPQTFWNSLSFSTYEKAGGLLSYEVTAFSPLGENFQDSEQIVLARLRKQWPQVRIFPGASETEEQELPFIADWLQLIQKNEGEKILDFFGQVPAKYHRNFQLLNVFWNFTEGQKISGQDVEIALSVPELHTRAEKRVLNRTFFELQAAFRLLPLMTSAGQEVLLNCLLKEKTLAEIRENPVFCRPLVAALAGEGTKPAQKQESVPASQPVCSNQTPRESQRKIGCLGGLLFLFVIFVAFVF